jgi:hypothetical protein
METVNVEGYVNVGLIFTLLAKKRGYNKMRDVTYHCTPYGGMFTAPSKIAKDLNGLIQDLTSKR